MYFHKAQEKPRLYGSFQDRQYSIWRNLESIYGVDHESEVLILPLFWGLPCLDYSGYNNHGTNHGATYKDGSLDFDGDDYVDAPNSASLLNLPNGALTLSVRLIVPTDGGGRVLNKKTSANLGWYLSVDKYRRASLRMDRATTDLVSTTNAFFSLNELFFLTATYTGGDLATDIHIYVNSIEEDSYLQQINGVGAYASDSASELRIGRDNYSGYFDGLMDEARISKAVRTADQIALFNDNKYGLYQKVGRPIWSIPAAPPVGAIMNQFQGANLGADLFNGTLL